MSYGFSCQRTSKSSVKAFRVYGKLFLPTTYAGICPGDFNPQQVSQNVVPEMFYGYYYGSYGIDIGIRIGGGGGWRPFCYGLSGSIMTDAVYEGNIFSTSLLHPGDMLYMDTWFARENNGKYYACINVSKVGYNGNDLMTSPLKVHINNSFGNGVLTNGATVNREIVIAANSGGFETSGAYLTNAVFSDTGIVSPADITNHLVWNDSRSKVYSGNYDVNGASGIKVLHRRFDNAVVNTNRLKVIEVTNGVWGATEKVSIDCRINPQI